MNRTRAIRSLALAAIALGLALPVAAQNFLWQVDSLTNRVYLFGTVHAGKAGWFPLPPTVEKAFAECPVLAVEADITDQKAMQVSSAGSTYTPPDTLARHVDAADYARLLAIAADYDVPSTELDRMKPFMAASLLVFADWARLGYSPAFSVDGYLIELAHARGKRVVELEGVGAQMKLIDSLTDAQNRTVFAGTVEALESGLTDRQIEGIAHAWQIGDTEALLAVAKRYDERVPGAAQIEEKFVWSRNPGLLAKITGYLDTGKDAHFVAVGALHLVGPRGLVEALRSRGYQVRRIFVGPQGEKTR